MAEVVWTAPALADLDATADYIALDNPDAAKALVRKVFQHLGQLAGDPRSGAKPPELKGDTDRSSKRPVARSIDVTAVASTS